MYSSFSSLARLDAVAIADSSGRDISGALSVAPRGARQLGQPLLGLLGDQRRVGADRAEQRGGGPVRLLEQRQEQVQRVNLWVAVRRGAPDRGRTARPGSCE